MFEFGFGRRFHDINYFKVGVFVHIPWIHNLLEGIITKLCGKPSIWCNFIILKKNHTITCWISPIVHHLRCRLKYVQYSWNFLLSSCFSCFERLIRFCNVYGLSLHIIQSQCIVFLNHFHRTLGRDQELSALLCLHPSIEKFMRRTKKKKCLQHTSFLGNDERWTYPFL